MAHFAYVTESEFILLGILKKNKFFLHFFLYNFIFQAYVAASCLVTNAQAAFICGIDELLNFVYFEGECSSSFYSCFVFSYYVMVKCLPLIFVSFITAFVA